MNGTEEAYGLGATAVVLLFQGRSVVEGRLMVLMMDGSLSIVRVEGSMEQGKSNLYSSDVNDLLE